MSYIYGTIDSIDIVEKKNQLITLTRSSTSAGKAFIYY